MRILLNVTNTWFRSWGYSGEITQGFTIVHGKDGHAASRHEQRQEDDYPAGVHNLQLYWSVIGIASPHCYVPGVKEGQHVNNYVLVTPIQGCAAGAKRVRTHARRC